MRKIVVHRPGGFGVLRVESAPEPEPGPGDVLVEVEACGVNFADVAVRLGLYESARKLVGWPITPGFEIAGRVAAVGAGVSDLGVGEEVFGVTFFGGYASAIVLPRHQVFRRPPELDVVQAAGFPGVHLTAWYALLELAHPRPSSTVLVHSAAGGVGGALAQLARIARCRVIGVVGSSHKIAHAVEVGCEEVIDTSRMDLWETAERLVPSGFDVVLDANGVATLRQSYEHLAPGGRLVVYGFSTMLSRGRGIPNPAKLAADWARTPRFDPLRMTAENRSVLAFNLSFLFPRADLLAIAMEQLLGWLADGRLKPQPVTTFPLDRAADAHRALQSGQTVGKLVLVV